MNEGNGEYRVGIFVTAKKQIHPPPIVTTSWDAELTSEAILAGLNDAIDVSQLYHR